MSSKIIFEIPHQMKIDVWEYTAINNIGNRGTFDGSREQQFVGLIGELIVKQFFGLPPVLPNVNGFDGGFDIELSTGEKFDVKTMTRNVSMKPHYEHNIVASQMTYDVDFYVFCSLNKRANELEVNGYLPKIVFLHKATKRHRGDIVERDNGTSFQLQSDSFTIENRHLHDATVLENIVYTSIKYNYQ